MTIEMLIVGVCLICFGLGFWSGVSERRDRERRKSQNKLIGSLLRRCAAKPNLINDLCDRLEHDEIVE